MTRARLPIALPRLGVALGLALPSVNVGLTACGGKEGNEPNALPSAPGTTTGTDDDDDDDDDVVPTEGVDTEGPDAFPRSYRFDCVDIQIVGDGDGDAFQAVVLENAWSNDIRDAKLNILLTVTERDEMAGTAKLQVTSGVGGSPSDLCSEPGSVSQVFDAAYEPTVSSWTDARDEMLCSKDGAGSSAAGTYELSLGPDDVVYVYAEDDDGTTFNCTASPDLPDAVPIRAVEARVTVDPDEQIGYGNLLGCLAVSEASALCSCIGACIGDPHPDCGGCPNGSRPLSVLLEGINPSSRCTELLGEDAFDLQLGMVTELLGYVPETCG